MTPQYDVAIRDVLSSLTNWRMWGRLGWQENKRRYRRTTIGPFWTTLSLGVLIGMLGLVWSKLWNPDPRIFLPYLCAGMLVWSLMSSIINEGCSVFIAGEGLIKHFQFPYVLLACSVVWRNVIGFLHNLIILVFVWRYADVPITGNLVWFLPALLLLCINSVWVCILLGICCARYRDLQQVITTIVTVSVFVTPILFTAEQMGARGAVIVDSNILYHFLNLVRSPLLGQAPRPLNWAVVFASTILGWLVTLFVYSRFRRRIPYWL